MILDLPENVQTRTQNFPDATIRFARRRLDTHVCLSVCLCWLQVFASAHVLKRTRARLSLARATWRRRDRYSVDWSRVSDVDSVFSARCNICISRLCYDVSVRLSVRLSVTEVHWRIIANLGFKFRSNFTAHCRRCAACGRIISRHASQC